MPVRRKTLRTPQVSGRRRILLGAALVLVAIAVPLLTPPTLPRLSWLPVLLGLAPWIIGKYVGRSMLMLDLKGPGGVGVQVAEALASSCRTSRSWSARAGGPASTPSPAGPGPGRS